MQGWGGGKADLYRIEMVQHAPIAGDVIALIPECDFGIIHLAVEQIAAMAFVHHDAIVGVHRQTTILCVQHPPDQSLHGRDVHSGIRIGLLFVDLLDAEHIGETLQRLHLRFLERIGRLLAQRGTVDQEQDAAEALRF